MSAAPKTTFGRQSRCSLARSAMLEPLVEALDRAVLAGVGDRLRQSGRELVDLRHERRDEGREDRKEADDEAKEHHGRGRPPADSRLQALDQGVECDRQERSRQRPHEDVAHPPREVADEGQREQPGDDLDHRGSGDVDRHAAPGQRLGQCRLGGRGHRLCPLLDGVHGAARPARPSRADRRSWRAHRPVRLGVGEWPIRAVAARRSVGLVGLAARRRSLEGLGGIALVALRPGFVPAGPATVRSRGHGAFFPGFPGTERPGHDQARKWRPRPTFGRPFAGAF